MNYPAISLRPLFFSVLASFRLNLPLKDIAALVVRNLVPVTLTALSLVATATAGSPYRVIYRFPHKPAGYWPTELIADRFGNLYGTTNSGGDYGQGTAYRLTLHKGQIWERTVLYSFPSGGLSGAGAGSLVLDQAGNLFGLASFENEFGVVFELSPPKSGRGPWTATNIQSFSGWDGHGPSGLAIDRSGILYGTTAGGGRDCGGIGCGTIYKLAPPSARRHQWTRTTLYFFKGVLGEGLGDGANPLGVTIDSHGNLYGITSGGGNCNPQDGCGGTAFELKPPTRGHNTWTESVLYRFAPGSSQLLSSVAIDMSGALYGATAYSLYQLVPNKGLWTESTIASGCYLYNRPMVGLAGNVYGTSLYCNQYVNGAAFKLTFNNGSWHQTLLHAFSSGRDGQAPDSGVVFGIDGALYGTTLRGGNDQCVYYGNIGCGTVFRVLP